MDDSSPQLTNAPPPNSDPNDPNDTTYRKVFVGGLPWSTNTDSLRAHFYQYGEITEAVVIVDRETGRSKGFGFITFASSDAASRAVADPNPTIDGRRTNCNLAFMGAKRRETNDRPQNPNNPNVWQNPAYHSEESKNSQQQQASAQYAAQYYPYYGYQYPGYAMYPQYPAYQYPQAAYGQPGQQPAQQQPVAYPSQQPAAQPATQQPPAAAQQPQAMQPVPQQPMQMPQQQMPMQPMQGDQTQAAMQQPQMQMPPQ